MTSAAIFFVFILSTICSVVAVDGSLEAAPVFTLDLAKPPATRWIGSVDLVLASHHWNVSFGPVFREVNITLYGYLSDDVRRGLTQVVKSKWPTNFQEIEGIALSFASVGHPEVDASFLCFWVFWHELMHANDLPKHFGGKFGSSFSPRQCTGVLALPLNESLPVIHGRNLDQGFEYGRFITLQINVVNSSSPTPTQVLYQAVDFYWFTSGFVTATMIDGVTLEENWRWGAESQTLAEITKRILSRDVVAVPQVFMFRVLLEDILPKLPIEKRWKAAVDYLTTSTFAAPFYAIMSGYPRAAAILSISFYSSRNVIEVMDPRKEWFMVQTNYDRWKPDPSNDPRRTTGERVMKMLGQSYGATRLGVWMTISEHPVLNGGTFYSVLMDISENTRGFIR